LSADICCVAFDAVGTLIYPEPSVSHAYWDIGRFYGSRLTPEEVRVRFQTTFQDLASGVRRDYSTSELEERERWKQIVAAVLTDVNDIDHCFEQLHAHFAKPSSWRCFPDVSETLETLDTRGIQILVASNFDERLNRLCDEMQALRLIRRRVISASIGWHKPSRQFYSRLIRDAGCAPANILMVGDDHDNDVRAAREAGLRAVLIDRQGLATNDVLTDLRQILSMK